MIILFSICYLLIGFSNKKQIENNSYKITKKEFINMISRKFISTLLDFNKEQITTGINDINFKYKKNLRFNDKLVCIIIKNN